MQVLMERVRFALQELDVHLNTVWVNGEAQKRPGDALIAEGCTWPSPTPGVFQVPGSPCPVCEALTPPSPASEITAKGNFAAHLKKNRELRNRGQGNIRRHRDGVPTWWPTSIGSPWNPFSSPKDPWIGPSQSRVSNPFEITGMPGLASGFRRGSVGTSTRRPNVPISLGLGTEHSQRRSGQR